MVRGTIYVMRYNLQFLQIKKFYIVPVMNSCACAKTSNRTGLVLIASYYLFVKRNKFCHKARPRNPANKDFN